MKAFLDGKDVFVLLTKGSGNTLIDSRFIQQPKSMLVIYFIWH